MHTRVDDAICWPNPHGRDGRFGDAAGCVNDIAPPLHGARQAF